MEESWWLDWRLDGWKGRKVEGGPRKTAGLFLLYPPARGVTAAKPRLLRIEIETRQIEDLERAHTPPYSTDSYIHEHKSTVLGYIEELPLAAEEKGVVDCLTVYSILCSAQPRTSRGFQARTLFQNTKPPTPSLAARRWTPYLPNLPSLEGIFGCLISVECLA